MCFGLGDILLADIVKEFKEEIRKLKAMIVKHENRIRALESTIKEREEATNLPDISSTISALDMGPDEV
ncbi:Domain of unknown function (DUF1899) [Nesidiocoris tenuis]|uniref:Uncharacterized protein n=1 Tax=Nesidiocoris tenuis TaxID=355587 RepID=A0ABN7AEY5_9HEMI|nr:Domain of unknown function (DUF1899) [Nesidiocoris tenuis]